MKEINDDFHDVVGLRLCDKVSNIAERTSKLEVLHTPLSCDKKLVDLNDCHEVI